LGGDVWGFRQEGNGSRLSQHLLQPPVKIGHPAQDTAGQPTAGQSGHQWHRPQVKVGHRLRKL